MTSIGEILGEMKRSGWSADNVAFGSGGGLLQKLDRDTQSFALRCSYVEVDGVGHDVFKRPAIDPGKNSKRGRLKLVRTDPPATARSGAPGEWRTVAERDEGTDELREVFRDGRLVIEETLSAIRSRAAF